jgi:hypothetical protein
VDDHQASSEDQICRSQEDEGDQEEELRQEDLEDSGSDWQITRGQGGSGNFGGRREESSLKSSLDGGGSQPMDYMRNSVTMDALMAKSSQ